jgi:hypothetical protein
MKTVTCTNTKFEVVDWPTPTPAKGQLLIDVMKCGICGIGPACAPPLRRTRRRDGRIGLPRLHAIKPAGRVRARVLRRGGRLRPRYTQNPPARHTVVSVPLLRRGKEVHGIGLSTMASGAYAEQLLVEQSLTFAVPNGLAPQGSRADRADGCRVARR